jgi:hypothetical protein
MFALITPVCDTHTDFVFGTAKMPDEGCIKKLENGRKMKFAYQELGNQVVESPFLTGSVGTGLPDLMVTDRY